MTDMLNEARLVLHRLQVDEKSPEELYEEFYHVMIDVWTDGDDLVSTSEECDVASKSLRVLTALFGHGWYSKQAMTMHQKALADPNFNKKVRAPKDIPQWEFDLLSGRCP